MTDAYSREEAYELNEIAGWEEFAYGPMANPTTAKFRNAGGGNGTRTWGLSEASLPMGATGYMRIDTTSATNSDNTISQDSVPLVSGEVYTIGAFVRGKGYFTCGPTQDGYYRAAKAYVDHPAWRFYGGTFTAKSESQNMYWRNQTLGTDDYAGSLEICAPLLMQGEVLPVVIATDTRTLALAVDVQQVDTYYYQTASTDTTPSKPTVANPSGWQATEYAFDASKAVWSCQKTTLTDGTFYWGAVSKWSAYEGSVVAWNKANAAQSAAAEAAKVAGNYIVETASNDAWIHSEGHGPNSSGVATADTYGWRIGSVFELVRAGLSYMMLWVESSVTKLRLGLATAGHAILSSDGMEVFAGTNGADSVAKFGSETRIGKSGGARFVTNASSLQAYNSSNAKYFEVSSSGLTWGTNTAATTTQVSEAAKRTYVSIRATAVDFNADTATLEATLYVDGAAKTSSVTYAWLKDGTAMTGETARTLSVTTAKGGLEHAYSCTATY